MSVESVKINILGEETELKSIGYNRFFAEINAPDIVGDYIAEVTVTDHVGNAVTVNGKQNKTLVLTVSNWTAPKTNWTKYDRFNWKDYNRIKNNLVHLHERANALSKHFEIEDMGEDITSYLAYWDVDVFNMFERNLDKINQNFRNEDYGEGKVFYPNAPFIQWEELNRIESAILNIKRKLTDKEKTLRRVPFKLGRYREVRL